MIENKFLRFSISVYSKWSLHPLQIKGAKYRFQNLFCRYYADKPGAKGTGAKEEKISSIKMPGFVHPETINEEGYFTQKAKQQLEELKNRLDKPTVENTDKKD